MNQEPVRISNELEDFAAGGLWPGGNVKFEEICYKLWDYNGKRPPDSQVAVYVRAKPLDGSNEGADVEIYWSVGPASDFQPDSTGGTLIGVATRHQQSLSSNWAHVYDKFRKTCGLQKGALSGPKGIRILEGSEVRIARVPQPAREGLSTDREPGEGGKGRPSEIYVPTWAKYPWEGKKGGAAPTPAPAQATQAAQAPATASTPAPTAASNGTSPTTLGDALAIVLASQSSITVSDLGKAVLGALAGADRSVRMSITKEAKDVNAIEEAAILNDWKFDGTTLSLS